jgi:glycosyltransferase involved in cell wall biosynthesis
LKVAFVVPAYQAERSVGDVVRELCMRSRELAETTDPSVIVVDDGSTDRTAREAESAGATLLRKPVNEGKGAALRDGFRAASALGARVAVSVDADGQHPSEEALRLAQHPAPSTALVLGVRDLARDGAPPASRFSNGFSNRWMSWFSGRRLSDTQCGLRRYPLPETLALELHGTGYEFEAEVILKALSAGLPLVEVPVRVVYPPVAERVSHFRSVRDPTRIVLRILQTVLSTRLRAGARG